MSELLFSCPGWMLEWPTPPTILKMLPFMLEFQRWEFTAVDWESCVHIPGREYHPHMTRVPLMLRRSASRLPPQPLAHADNASVCPQPYVCLHVSRTATSNTAASPSHNGAAQREEE